jgi:hypothetical protein
MQNHRDSGKTAGMILRATLAAKSGFESWRKPQVRKNLKALKSLSV